MLYFFLFFSMRNIHGSVAYSFIAHATGHDWFRFHKQFRQNLTHSFIRFHVIQSNFSEWIMLRLKLWKAFMFVSSILLFTNTWLVFKAKIVEKISNKPKIIMAAVVSSWISTACHYIAANKTIYIYFKTIFLDHETWGSNTRW